MSGAGNEAKDRDRLSSHPLGHHRPAEPMLPVRQGTLCRPRDREHVVVPPLLHAGLESTPISQCLVPRVGSRFVEVSSMEFVFHRQSKNGDRAAAGAAWPSQAAIAEDLNMACKV